MGTLSGWKKHEIKQNNLKKHIAGMNLDMVSKGRRGSDLNSTAYTYGMESKMPMSQSSQRPPKGNFMLPKLGADGNFKTMARQSETAGQSRRKRMDLERSYTTNQSPSPSHGHSSHQSTNLTTSVSRNVNFTIGQHPNLTTSYGS